MEINPQGQANQCIFVNPPRGIQIVPVVVGLNTTLNLSTCPLLEMKLPFLKNAQETHCFEITKSNLRAHMHNHIFDVNTQENKIGTSLSIFKNQDF